MSERWLRLFFVGANLFTNDISEEGVGSPSLRM